MVLDFHLTIFTIPAPQTTFSFRKDFCPCPDLCLTTELWRSTEDSLNFMAECFLSVGLTLPGKQGRVELKLKDNLIKVKVNRET